MHTVGQLGRRFGLSRSALLYYDAIGLLSPRGRSRANYRLYGEDDLRRLERIMAYRAAGVPLDDIRALLDADPATRTATLERQLLALNREIARLREQQRVIARLLGVPLASCRSRALSKAEWVALLRSTGLDEAGMHAWHVEFERMSPDAHQDFLESLGIPLDEVAAIRQWAAGRCENPR